MIMINNESEFITFNKERKIYTFKFDDVYKEHNITDDIYIDLDYPLEIDECIDDAESIIISNTSIIFKHYTIIKAIYLRSKYKNKRELKNFVVFLHDNSNYCTRIENASFIISHEILDTDVYNCNYRYALKAKCNKCNKTNENFTHENREIIFCDHCDSLETLEYYQ